ncbi:MAG: hypothetical protein R8N23_16025 [Reichenbachiella sp.]|uniref:hypothetical protein n=1 Tax=Reichenbachiella sp. TaxID=2184521 RepID=UPI002965FE38|nr:hypothetical protein [Reichenbachiella sp.]MDW3211385.1 hypothetical protein [Reichenbachiella sp.]
MKKTQILLGLLLLSVSTFGQTIISQKSDTINEKPKLQYFGDDKEEVKTPIVEDNPNEELPIRVDTVTTQPVVIKYYQATEPYQREEEPKKNKNQIKTLTGKMHHSGGYGAVSFKTSNFKDKTLVMAGIRGAWIVNRTLAIGIDGYGIIPTTKYQNIDPDDATNEVRLQGGYGGLMLEPIFFSNEVVHITFPVSAGAGWLGYEDPDNEDFWDNRDNLVDEDVFWYIEPGANLEINIAHNFRLDLGVSKRFTQDLQLVNTLSDEFDEINYYLTLKIGGF